MDLIKQLGHLAFASRLKRLSERLQKDVSRVYKAQSIDFEARWFPVLRALGEQPSMSVTGLAAALRLTHPAINQIAADMSKHGLVSSSKDRKDERRRLLRLTPKGHKMITVLEPVWREIQVVNQELTRNTGSNLLQALDRFEAALDEEGMYERVIGKIKLNQMQQVEIIDYRPNLKRYFKRLNYEWLKKWFKVEELDEKILSNPSGEIIRPGGHVFFALIEGKVIGTAAIIRHEKNVYELTKMAVTPRAQGRQAGRKLTLAVIEWVKKHKARTLILHTARKLTPAVNLYKSLGFEEVDGIDIPLPHYQRKTIMMRLDLKKR
jgi:DNA-binding MarR family transcriptional regulator